MQAVVSSAAWDACVLLVATVASCSAAHLQAAASLHTNLTLILRWSGYWYFHSDTAPSPDAVMMTSLFCGSGCAPHTVLPLPELLFTR
jgi:hypothetical protein